jgi:uncharacterized membrane protein required for colicin V production
MTVPAAVIPFINYIVIALIVIAMILGYRKGIIYQLLGLLSTLASILLSWYFAPELAAKYRIFPESLTPFTGTAFAEIFYDKLNDLLWYAVLFIGFLLIFQLLKPVAKAMVDLPVIGFFNRALGSLIAVIPACLVLIMVAYFFSTPLVINGKDVLNGSVLGPIHNASANVLTVLKGPYLKEGALQKLLHNDALTTEDVEALWKWLISENADPEDIRAFLEKYDGDFIIPDANTGN